MKMLTPLNFSEIDNDETINLEKMIETKKDMTLNTIYEMINKENSFNVKIKIIETFLRKDIRLLLTPKIKNITDTEYMDNQDIRNQCNEITNIFFNKYFYGIIFVVKELQIILKEHFEKFIGQPLESIMDELIVAINNDIRIKDLLHEYRTDQ